MFTCNLVDLKGFSFCFVVVVVVVQKAINYYMQTAK
jgi:hypothetical protein